MYRILIVEDDSTIASNVAAHLERWDYETKQIEDFKCVMEAFQQFDPQLVIVLQPENPWSLDRGMNGVRYREHTFTENMIFR